jgi:putative endonuclease
VTPRDGERAAAKPVTSRRALGDFGERVAAAHLEAKGYRILATKFRCRDGEVDIIAQDGETVAFVEVKTRRGNAMGTALEAIDARKAECLLLAAEAYVVQHPELPEGQRIDLIAVDLDRSGKVLSVQHIESAVE